MTELFSEVERRFGGIDVVVDTAGYAATKAAVEALTLILAREPRGRGITVNAVAPGPTAAPLERLGTPPDIAECVAFLAGPAGRWINGQVLYANGGIA